MRYVLAAVAALGLGACTTNQSWTRIDGNRSSSSDLQHARLICEPRAQAAADSATASSPSPRNTSDAIASGITEGLAKGRIRDNVLNSCMAERGYVIASR